MKFKKIISIVATITLFVLTLTSCVNVYKQGVEYHDFPDRDIPIYDDAIVFEYECGEKKCEITYGTTDDVDDILDFYSDEFDDDYYVIINEEIDKDEYKVEGFIDELYFEIEANEASGDSEKYFDCVVSISTEEVDKEIVEEYIIQQEILSNTILPEVLEIQLMPSRDLSILEAQIKPLQDLLEVELDMNVNVTIAKDTDTLIKSMETEQVHVGFLFTIAYINAADEGSAEAILKSLRYDTNEDGSYNRDMPLVAGYYSQLLVHSESKIEDVLDLAGKKIAVSSFLSTSGFVWPANLLADNGIDPETDVEWVNVGGHDNAILALLNHEVDAAFTFKDARTAYFIEEDYYQDIMDTCVFLMNTELIPYDIISVIPNLNPNLKEKIQQAFLNIVLTKEGLEIIRAMYGHDGYVKVIDSEYEKVRVYLNRQKGWRFN